MQRVRSIEVDDQHGTAESLLDHAKRLAEGMWSAAIVLDHEGTAYFWNEGAEVLTGYAHAELGLMRSSEWGELFRIRSRDGSPFPLDTMPGWLDVQRGRVTPTVGHVRMTSREGIERFISIMAVPLFTELGKFVGAIAHIWEEEEVPGERLVATLLFCDQRGHTADVAALEPDRVKEALTVFYEHMARLINRHGGTLLSFAGDEVFAAWGAPAPVADGPDRAVRCARILQDARPALDQKLRARGLPSVSFGIGIHTGEVVDAHVGFGRLRQYTVTGDAVNCASRLCTIAGRNEIIVSGDTYERLTEKPPAEVLPGIRFKGVERDLLAHRLWPDELRDPTGESRRGKVEPAG